MIKRHACAHLNMCVAHVETSYRGGGSGHWTRISIDDAIATGNSTRRGAVVDKKESLRPSEVDWTMRPSD